MWNKNDKKSIFKTISTSDFESMKSNILDQISLRFRGMKVEFSVSVKL